MRFFNTSLCSVFWPSQPPILTLRFSRASGEFSLP